MTAIFRKFAERVAIAVGTPWGFIIALSIIVCWGLSGPVFAFSEQWQLIINSFTTIVTFLMVFIIQNTQNRDFKSLQIKLDSLLLAVNEVPNGMVNLHDLPDKDLNKLERAFARMAGRIDVGAVIESLEALVRERRAG
jgi:low affinity Fe/Cu permease